MTHVGVDIEQFVRDPYGSGIQRVLQLLAAHWDATGLEADFVVPVGRDFALLTPQAAAAVLSVPFAPRPAGVDVRDLVAQAIADADAVRVRRGDLLAIVDAWLLPEVSYLPSVLERFETFGHGLPTAMIGYDTLPMSEPGNYRFAPGSAAWVSEYFRLLATADAVACISDYARDSILGRLRRDPALPISVALPGGDHLPARQPRTVGDGGRPTFVRLGTLEARKRPVEILTAFTEAVRERGVEADLLFIGGPSASDEGINAAVRSAVAAGLPVRWVDDASDARVHDLVADATVFLSIGTEGFGIPVLEAIRLGTPVLYDGIQPAGDAMAGRGAQRVPAMDHAALVDLFTRFSAPGALDAVRRGLDPDAVPTWSAFAAGVGDAVRQAVEVPTPGR